MMSSVPPLQELMNSAGMDLLKYLGTKKDEESTNNEIIKG